MALALTLAGMLAHAATPAVIEPVENNAPLVLAARANDRAALQALLAAQPRPDLNQRTADGTSGQVREQRDHRAEQHQPDDQRAKDGNQARR